MPRKNSALASLRRRIAKASTGSGVYRWKDKEGNVLYVGKAKNLRNRLQHYVRDGVKRSAWTEILVSHIADFDLTLTNTDLEALILETNLIKQLKPKYNIMMKDDKNYVYLRISVQDVYPRIEIVRRMEKDGALYFGPKTSAETLRTSLGFLRTIFPFRTCKMGIHLRDTPSVIPSTSAQTSAIVSLDVVCSDRDRPTPCLDYHIKRCAAPCIGAVSPENYRRIAIDGVIAFFSGKYQEVERVLRAEMAQAVAARKFERAAHIRDHLHELHALQEKQIISDTSHRDADVIGVALLSGRASIVLLQQRDGKLVGEEHFSLRGHADSVSEVLGQFLPQYYAETSDIPATVLLAQFPGEYQVLASWLSALRGAKVILHVPERGNTSQLLQLAEKNAQWKATQAEAKWESQSRKMQDALTALQSLLSLPTTPVRIEGYDISHMGGADTVGSMVVFVDGKPKPDHYRSFNIRTVKHGDIDDYQSLREMLTRRLRALAMHPQREEERFRAEGLTFGKARLADQSALQEALACESFIPPFRSADFVVARRDAQIVACVRLCFNPDKLMELSSFWVHPSLASSGIVLVLARRALRSVKKGKVYAVLHATQESYFASLGFRYVMSPSSALQKSIDRYCLAHDVDHAQVIAMVCDARDLKADASFSARPDLILIDGGKGQLRACAAVLECLHLDIPLASIAKREEEIFLPSARHPVAVPKDSPAQFLLQRLRDEAHRFANARREKRGRKTLFHSVLDDVPSIGDVLKQSLLKRFGSVEGIRQASDAALLTLLSARQLHALRSTL